MIELTKLIIKCWQWYSYCGKIDMGPDYTQISSRLMQSH